VFDGVARHQGVTLSLASFKEAISGEPQSTLTMEQTEGARATPLASLFPDRLPTLREAEDHLITEALLRADGNQTVAAGLLGLSRQALNKRLSRRRGSDSPADRNGESDQADRMSQR
jgi:two-component system, NtrC family, nitrogen regulation response regulator GlnG